MYKKKAKNKHDLYLVEIKNKIKSFYTNIII